MVALPLVVVVAAGFGALAATVAGSDRVLRFGTRAWCPLESACDARRLASLYRS